MAIAGAGVAIAQQSGIKRTPLQKLDFPAGYTAFMARWRKAFNAQLAADQGKPVP